jgi:ATP-dependent Clp protease protease subunit
MTMPPFPPEFPSQTGAADLLLQRRIVLAHGRLDGARATELSAKLMTLGASGEEPITLHLRMPDGDLEAAFAVADAITVVACPVHIVVGGQTGGPALLVLAEGRRREMTPHATLRLTEPSGAFEGDATDVAAAEHEHRRRVDAFYIRLAEVTGREVDEIREDARGGRLLTADQALEYGLIERIT